MIDVERTGLGQQLIEDVDLVHLADVDEGRDAAAQIEQRVQFDRPRRVSTSDSGLSCLAGSGPACATVVKAETGRELRWAGSLPGLLRAEHYFLIERIGTARLRFRHGEIFSGLLVPIVWPILRGNGREVYEAMNVALKQRVKLGAEGASV
jgi:hypothetical protein